MAIRRVVTGVSPDGKPGVISDGLLPPTLSLPDIPGYEITELFATKVVPPTVGDALLDPRAWQLTPSAGEVAWRIVVRPPDGPSGSDASTIVASTGAQAWGKAPSEGGHIDGMHRTDSIDLVTVVSGELWLTVGETEVHLRPGDCVVQMETPHAWHNYGDQPCIMVAVMIRTVPSR